MLLNPATLMQGTDLKQILLTGLSPAGQTNLRFDFPFEAAGVEWAQDYLAGKPETILARLKLGSDEDKARFTGNFDNLKDRLSLARTIAQGTDVTDAVQRAFDAQKDHMLEGIIVFSDGRSNVGLDARTGRDDVRHSPALDNLHRAAKKAQIPIFTVAVGEHRETKSVRITGLQAPSQTPPDDPFKIIVDVDGENMKGATVDVFLELFEPNMDIKGEPSLTIPGKATFEQGEPPTGQHEWTINPPEIIKAAPERIERQNAQRQGIARRRLEGSRLHGQGRPKKASPMPPNACAATCGRSRSNRSRSASC